MEQTWGMDLIRSFFGVIDKAVYSLMATIYQIILDIANTTVLGTDVIQDLYARMYTLLGIFMLFKVTFSFINYLINPDSFTDKQKGVQNLVKNVLIVLILIIITPFAFDKLYEVQDAILSDNLIPRFLLGVNNSSSDAEMLEHSFQMSDECPISAVAATDGDYLALTTLRPFYQLESTTTDIPPGYCAGGEVTPADYLVSKIYNGDKFWEDIYLVDYKFFLSTIVGIVVCLILVSFCFDIAVRSIKLGFLEMLAPIPIMSYIDPASSKNGMFSKWLKQVGSTWASLFIRLIALFFAVLVISKIDVSIGGSNKFWVMLFILIGALIFAKQLPKLLEELIPGLKLGGMQLNPFKKIANDALGGKQLLGLGAGALGLGLGAASYAGYRIKEGRQDAKEKKEYDTYNRFKDKLDKFRATPGKSMSDAAYQKILDKKLETLPLAMKYEDNHTKRMDTTSFAHPILSGLKQTFRGGTIAFDQGQKLKFNPIEIGKKSSAKRDYEDKYSLKDRVTDSATDFFGIKNESGTTSIVKQGIKDQQEILTRINRNIEMMNRSFSDLATRMGPAEFNQAVTMDAKGNYIMNSSYNGIYKNEIESILSQMSTLETQRLATTKEINRLEKIRDQKPQPPK